MAEEDDKFAWSKRDVRWRTQETSTKREQLLAQLARVQDEWAAEHGDTAETADAEAEAAYYRKAQPILDELAALRARGGSPRR